MKNRMQIGMIALALVCSSAVASYAQWGKKQVPQIGVQQLVALQGDSQQSERLTIVDVRSPAECRVSTIPGAITRQQFKQQRSAHRGKVIVVYCTSGYRSAKYVTQLRKQGFDARDLQGSILGWCQARQPLTTQTGTETNRVHVYNARNRVPDIYEAVY